VLSSDVTSEEQEAELDGLLDAILNKYHYDFRHYTRVSLRRRVKLAVERMNTGTILGLQNTITNHPSAFPQLLNLLTVPVSDLFRDAPYFRALREHVVPVLRTYPSLKIWVAGCSTGEEVYSLAIVLQEEGLLARTILYATDINPHSLRTAEAGVYAIERFQRFSENYRLAGGKASLSDYYQASDTAALFDRRLKKNIVFSDHSLATDSVFAEVQLVSCRNVLIYFDRVLQGRAVGLFSDSLCRHGFLGLGMRESLRFGPHSGSFEDVVPEARLFRRRS
jgi:chemotaxis protein methyltransferase CheR